MAGFLVAALGIPSAFTGGGVALGYLLGRIEGSVLHAMGRLGPFDVGTAALVLAAGFTRGAVTRVVWTVASLARLGALAASLIATCLLDRRDPGDFLRRGVESGGGRS